MILIFIMDLVGMLWWAASHLPPSGGGSYRKICIVLEPVGSRSNGIFIYIIIFICMYVCMYQGRFKVGNKVRIISVGIKFASLRWGTRFASFRSGSNSHRFGRDQVWIGSSSGPFVFSWMIGRSMVLGSEPFMACTRSHVHTGCCSPRECSHPPSPHRCR